MSRSPKRAREASKHSTRQADKLPTVAPETGNADPLGLHGSPTEPRSLMQLIEVERSRLVFADSVLTCLHEALVATETRHRTDSSCADVALIARSLVREAGHRLDRVFVIPLIDALAGKGRADRGRH